MSIMKLTVVIVSYNVKYYLEQCLISLERALKGVEAEIVVVDNDSRDGTVDYLKSCSFDVRIIESNHNLGFARANNIAIEQTDSEYVLLLNPDTVVGESVIRDTLEFMNSHPDAGGLGVQMIKSDGNKALESRRGLPTPLTSFFAQLLKERIRSNPLWFSESSLPGGFICTILDLSEHLGRIRLYGNFLVLIHC